MRLPPVTLALVLTLVAPGSALAQGPGILGTWQADLKDADRKDAPRTVVVRADSSASYGQETVRWRLVARGDSVALALGGEWVVYGLKVRGTKLTLSGGDLAKPITLTRIGPPTPRPDSIPIPPDPDAVAP
ncbi:MAG TPA: hypothetical protein VNJ71_00015 [Gemmatimonadales bacterium]|nr:hypothetical protein [Gemmatimonadales bacterium]